MSEHAELPWYSAANSWQYTTIYDVNGNTVCRFDLEDWCVTEANQDALEKAQAEIVQRIILAANHHHALVEALEAVKLMLSYHANEGKPAVVKEVNVNQAWHAANNALAAVVKEASNG